MCDTKKSMFIKELKVSRLLGNLGMRTRLGKISLVGPLLFKGIKKLIQDLK